jgi:hypothetical protein
MYSPGLKLTLGRHGLAQYFYLMDLPYTNVILGVQWLSALGPITTNYKTMEMSFNGENGKRVILKGMHQEWLQPSAWKPFLGGKTWFMQHNS